MGSDSVEETGNLPTTKEEEGNGGTTDLSEDVISLGSQDTISDDSSTNGRDNKYTKHHKSLMRLAVHRFKFSNFSRAFRHFNLVCVNLIHNESGGIRIPPIARITG